MLTSITYTHITECIEPLQKELVATTLAIKDLRQSLSHMGGEEGALNHGSS